MLISNHSLRLPSFTSATLLASNLSSLLVMHTLVNCFIMSHLDTETFFFFVSLLNHFKGYNLLKTQHPGSSPIADDQHTSPPFSTNSIGYQFCPRSNSKYYCSPSKRSTTLLPPTSATSSSLTLHPTHSDPLTKISWPSPAPDFPAWVAGPSVPLAPKLWNSLPQPLCDCPSLTLFKAHLKTFLFNDHFSTPNS